MGTEDFVVVAVVVVVVAVVVDVSFVVASLASPFHV